MSANIELTEQELAELRELRHAMREYIRYAKRMCLKELSGKVTMENNWQELEQRELDLMRLAEHEPAFAFWVEHGEAIYTLKDGSPV